MYKYIREGNSLPQGKHNTPKAGMLPQHSAVFASISRYPPLNKKGSKKNLVFYSRGISISTNYHYFSVILKSVDLEVRLEVEHAVDQDWRKCKVDGEIQFGGVLIPEEVNREHSITPVP